MICSIYIEKVILFFMETKNSISIKRSIAIKAIVTPTWKEDAEKELSNAISNIDKQLSQLEQEGQQIVNNIRSQSVNPLDPRVQEQVSQVQQQVAAKRNEIEEQKRNLLQHCLLYTSPSPRDS